MQLTTSCTLLMLVLLAGSSLAAHKSWYDRFPALSRHASTLAGRLGQSSSARNHRSSAPVDHSLNEATSGGTEADNTDSSMFSGDASDLKRLLHRQRGHHSNNQPKNKRLNGRNEICLFKALRRCGNQLIADISSNDDFDNRCTTKEDFLDCMTQMQHGGCRLKRTRHGPSRALVEQYQQRLRRLLQSTRGCVIGVDLSSTTPTP